MKKFIPNVSALLFLLIGTAHAYLTPIGGGGGGGGAVDSVNGQTGVVVLETDNINEGSTNLWFLDVRAQNACVDNTIIDGVTNKAPSQNAVFDSLALKQDLLSGTPDTLAFWDSSGDPGSLNQWSVNDQQYLNNITSVGPGDSRADFYQTKVQTNLDGEVTSLTRSIQYSLQGAGTNNEVVQVEFNLGIPVTNNATVMNLNVSNSTTVGGDLYGLGINTDAAVTGSLRSLNVGNSGAITANLNGSSVSNTATVGANATLSQVSNSGAITNNLNMRSSFNNGTVGGDFSNGNYGNNGDVAGFSRSINIGDNNNITKGATAYTYYHNGNIGDGTGTNATLVDSNYNSGIIDGDIVMVNNASNANTTGGYYGLRLTSNMSTLDKGGAGIDWNNSADFTGDDGTIYLGNLNNSARGYRFGGINLNNTEDMDEEVRFLRGFDSSDSRTKSGIDIQMEGNATDDAVGIRVNVNNLTSTNQQVSSLSLEGGHVSISSKYKLTSGAGVLIGDRYSSELTIDSPITGTDTFVMLDQPSVHLLGSKASGPFGLGLALQGSVPLMDVDSNGYTPVLRHFVMATNFISGSGATIDRFVQLELAGMLFSAGPSTIPSRTLIHDGIGNDYCDGATDCWFLEVENATAENFLKRLAINTSSKKVSPGVRLELHDGHVKFTQTTDVSATVNANAGTSATCVADGNDVIGSLTLTTGSAAWAIGEQCKITFNTAYNSAPKCTFSPTNDNAAMASLNAYITKSTTELGFNFVNADTASTEYKWDYRCDEK